MTKKTEDQENISANNTGRPTYGGVHLVGHLLFCVGEPLVAHQDGAPLGDGPERRRTGGALDPPQPDTGCRTGDAVNPRHRRDNIHYWDTLQVARQP